MTCAPDPTPENHALVDAGIEAARQVFERGAPLPASRRECALDAARDLLRRLDILLDEVSFEHAAWAHALLHQAAAHLSKDETICNQAEAEARACGGYGFTRVKPAGRAVALPGAGKAAFDPTKPFATRDGREVVMPISDQGVIVGIVEGVAAIWPIDGKHETDWRLDLVNTPDPQPAPGADQDGESDENTWRENVESLLSTGDADVIRCHEGGGPEDLVASLVLTMMRTRKTRDEARAATHRDAVLAEREGCISVLNARVDYERQRTGSTDYDVRTDALAKMETLESVAAAIRARPLPSPPGADRALSADAPVQPVEGR